MIWGINRTVRYKTNIPVFDQTGEFCFLSRLSITSAPQEKSSRKGTIKIGVTFGQPYDRSVMLETIRRLLMGLDNSIVDVFCGKCDGDFSVVYKLRGSESFCNSAIRKAKLLLEKFGIKDEGSFTLSDFVSIQDTLVKTPKGWIPHADYLRHQHGLKQCCTLYNQNIRIDNLVIRIEYKGSESNVFEER